MRRLQRHRAFYSGDCDGDACLRDLRQAIDARLARSPVHNDADRAIRLDAWERAVATGEATGRPAFVAGDVAGGWPWRSTAFNCLPLLEGHT
jgi:hypothetical protein